MTSAAAVAWQFAAEDPETREKTALRIIAFSFFALAAYVTVDAVRVAVRGRGGRPSTVGLVLAAVSLLVMPFLSYGQRRAGRELGSRTAVADSKQTLLCTYLSAVLLVGLGLNTAFGWSWADPIAALVIAAVAVKEGREAWQGDTCCAPDLSAPTDTAINGTPTNGIERRRHRGRRCLHRRLLPSDHCWNGGTTMTDTHQHAHDTGDGHAHTADDHGHGGEQEHGGGHAHGGGDGHSHGVNPDADKRYLSGCAGVDRGVHGRRGRCRDHRRSRWR